MSHIPKEAMPSRGSSPDQITQQKHLLKVAVQMLTKTFRKLLKRQLNVIRNSYKLSKLAFSNSINSFETTGLTKQPHLGEYITVKYFATLKIAIRQKKG